MHLREWLAVLTGSDLQLTVLHPAGNLSGLPEGVEIHALPQRSGPWATLRYEQFDQPRAAARLGCDALLIWEGGAPIAARLPIVALPGALPAGPAAGVLRSLQRAAGRAGRSVAHRVLYPGDGPPPAGSPGHARPFPPFVSAGFARLSPGGSKTYVLCYGLRRQYVALALAAWTWVDGSLGDTYPLLFLGVEPELEQFVRIVAAELDVTDSIEFRPQVQLDSLPGIYREAAAYLGVGRSAWGQPLRWALAAGVPIAAVEDPTSAAIVRQAGYLAPAGDARALGAACLSLLVQEDLADRQRTRGLQIAAAYSGATPIDQLRRLLQ